MFRFSNRLAIARRSLALATALLFLISNVFMPANVQAAPASAPKAGQAVSFSELDIPEQIGKVEGFFAGNSPDRQAVVIIQDAHSIPDAQRSIRKTILYLQKKYGVQRVGVEGASAELDTRVFKSYPDQEALQAIFKNYMDKGELSGAVSASIFGLKDTAAAGLQFFGVEDWPVYEEGTALYLAAMDRESAILAAVQRESEKLEDEKMRIYSRQLLAVDSAHIAFEQNKKDLLSYLKILDEVQKPEEGSEIALLLAEAANEGQDSDLEAEIREIARRLKNRYGHLSPHHQKTFNEKHQAFQTSQITAAQFALELKEIAEAAGIDLPMSAGMKAQAYNQRRMRDLEGTRLFKDIENYTKAIKESLFVSDQERKLDRRTRDVLLLEKWAKMELSREDWSEIKTRMAAPADQTEVAGVDTARTALRLNETVNLKDLFKYHEAFYQNAEKRDHAFIVSLEKKMTAGETACVVAGGFHAQGLAEHLAEKGISYALIMPAIETLPEDSGYRDHMRGNVDWRDYLAVENGKINLYDAFVRYTRDQLLSSPAAGQLVLKRWRDQILRDLAEEGGLARAGEYTRFIDETLQQGKQKTLDERRQKVERFLEGLKTLDVEGRFDAPNIARLLQNAQAGALAATIESAFKGAGVAVPGELLSPAVSWGGENIPIYSQISAKSEVRTNWVQTLESLVPQDADNRAAVIEHYAALPAKLAKIQSETNAAREQMAGFGFSFSLPDIDRRNFNDVAKKLEVDAEDLFDGILAQANALGATAQNPMRILDIGAGQGVFLTDLAGRLSTEDRARIQLVGLDFIAPEGPFRSQVDAAGIEWHEGLFEYQTLESLGGRTFDLILGVEVLQYAFDRDAFLAKVSELKSPAGQTLITSEQGLLRSETRSAALIRDAISALESAQSLETLLLGRNNLASTAALGHEGLEREIISAFQKALREAMRIVSESSSNEQAWTVFLELVNALYERARASSRDQPESVNFDLIEFLAPIQNEINSFLNARLQEADPLLRDASARLALEYAAAIPGLAAANQPYAPVFIQKAVQPWLQSALDLLTRVNAERGGSFNAGDFTSVQSAAYTLLQMTAIRSDADLIAENTPLVLNSLADPAYHAYTNSDVHPAARRVTLDALAGYFAGLRRHGSVRQASQQNLQLAASLEASRNLLEEQYIRNRAGDRVLADKAIEAIDATLQNLSRSEVRTNQEVDSPTVVNVYDSVIGEINEMIERYNIPENLLALEIDPALSEYDASSQTWARLERLLHEIITNGVKYTRDYAEAREKGYRFSVSIRSVEGKVVFQGKDFSIGIDPQEIVSQARAYAESTPEVFDLYVLDDDLNQRIKSGAPVSDAEALSLLGNLSLQSDQGSGGLGFMVIKETAERFQGTMRIDTVTSQKRNAEGKRIPDLELGSGTTITVEFPIESNFVKRSEVRSSQDVTAAAQLVLDNTQTPTARETALYRLRTLYEQGQIAPADMPVFWRAMTGTVSVDPDSDAASWKLYRSVSAILGSLLLDQTIDFAESAFRTNKSAVRITPESGARQNVSIDTAFSAKGIQIQFNQDSITAANAVELADNLLTLPLVQSAGLQIEASANSLSFRVVQADGAVVLEDSAAFSDARKLSRLLAISLAVGHARSEVRETPSIDVKKILENEGHFVTSGGVAVSTGRETNKDDAVAGRAQPRVLTLDLDESGFVPKIESHLFHAFFFAQFFSPEGKAYMDITRRLNDAKNAYGAAADAEADPETLANLQAQVDSILAERRAFAQSVQAAGYEEFLVPGILSRRLLIAVPNEDQRKRVLKALTMTFTNESSEALRSGVEAIQEKTGVRYSEADLESLLKEFEAARSFRFPGGAFQGLTDDQIEEKLGSFIEVRNAGAEPVVYVQRQGDQTRELTISHDGDFFRLQEEAGQINLGRDVFSEGGEVVTPWSEAQVNKLKLDLEGSKNGIPQVINFGTGDPTDFSGAQDYTNLAFLQNGRMILTDPSIRTFRNIEQSGLDGQISAVYLTHVYYDHVGGLLDMVRRKLAGEPLADFKLIAPYAAYSQFLKLSANLFGETEDTIARLFQYQAPFSIDNKVEKVTLEGDPAFEGTVLEFARTHGHPLPTYGIKLIDREGRKIAYLSDSVMPPRLIKGTSNPRYDEFVAYFSDADILIAENGVPGVHITPQELVEAFPDHVRRGTLFTVHSAGPQQNAQLSRFVPFMSLEAQLRTNRDSEVEQIKTSLIESAAIQKLIPLDEETAAQLATRGKIRTFEAGQRIFESRAAVNPHDEVYVVLSGEAEIHLLDEHFVSVGPGGILGEMALLTRTLMAAEYGRLLKAAEGDDVLRDYIERVTAVQPIDDTAYRIIRQDIHLNEEAQKAGLTDVQKEKIKLLFEIEKSDRSLPRSADVIVGKKGAVLFGIPKDEFTKFLAQTNLAEDSARSKLVKYIRGLTQNRAETVFEYDMLLSQAMLGDYYEGQNARSEVRFVLTQAADMTAEYFVTENGAFQRRMLGEIAAMLERAKQTGASLDEIESQIRASVDSMITEITNAGRISGGVSLNEEGIRLFADLMVDVLIGSVREAGGVSVAVPVSLEDTGTRITTMLQAADRLGQEGVLSSIIIASPDMEVRRQIQAEANRHVKNILMTLMPNLKNIRSFNLDNQSILPAAHSGLQLAETNPLLVGIGINANVDNLTAADRALLEVAEAMIQLASGAILAQEVQKAGELTGSRASEIKAEVIRKLFSVQAFRLVESLTEGVLEVVDGELSINRGALQSLIQAIGDKAEAIRAARQSA